MDDGLSLSGVRLTATYLLHGPACDVDRRARDICLEQTVEYPDDLIDRSDIKDQIYGRVEGVEAVAPDLARVRISYPVEVASAELTQLLNVLFGNISLKPGIRLASVDLPDRVLVDFAGPRFGVEGIRERTGARGRPVLCSAIKPMGLSNLELASLAGSMARGGMDMIKDDHGICDQVFSRFEDRVRMVAEEVERGNEESGSSCLYAPNITGPADQIVPRAKTAAKVGAGALLIAPGLVGFDTMRRIADDDEIGLPVISHPAFLGSFTACPTSGISHGVIYGLFSRLAGADATIFPSYGGRFSFSEEECAKIAGECRRALGEMAPIFPVPAGGMTLERVPSLVRFYGTDTMILMGGDLHRHGGSLEDGCRLFKDAVLSGIDEKGRR